MENKHTRKLTSLGSVAAGPHPGVRVFASGTEAGSAQNGIPVGFSNRWKGWNVNTHKGSDTWRGMMGKNAHSDLKVFLSSIPSSGTTSPRFRERLGTLSRSGPPLSMRQFGAVDRRCSGPPSRVRVPGMAQRQIQEMLERQCLSVGLGAPRNPPGRGSRNSLSPG